MQLLDFPNELILLIGEQLSPKDLSAFLTTNRAVHCLLTPRLHFLGAQPCSNGRPPTLHWAVSRGHESLIRGLLQKGAAINGTPYKCDLENCAGEHRSTALHEATKCDKTSVIRILLDNGGDVDAPDNHNATPVHWACGNSGIEVLALLLAQKPNLDARDGDGDPPVAWAAEKGLPQVFEFMLDHGSDMHALNNNSQTLMHTVFLRGDKYIDGHAAIVKILLDRGFTMIGHADINGCLAFHVAARAGSKAAVELMLPHVDINVTDLHHNTALYQACENDRTEMVQYLISKGADITIANGTQHTPLHIAAYHGYEVMNVLLEAGADVHARNNEGETVLLCAVKGNGGTDCIKSLLDRGADVNAVCESGNTALYLAHNDAAKVRFLLENGADVNARLHGGQTVLFRTAYMGYMEVCEVLIEFGADVFVEDNDGIRAVDRAVQGGEAEIAELLQKKMGIWKERAKEEDEDNDEGSGDEEVADSDETEDRNEGDAANEDGGSGEAEQQQDSMDVDVAGGSDEAELQGTEDMEDLQEALSQVLGE